MTHNGESPDRKSIWLRCPACNGKTRTKIYEDTTLLHFPLFCPKCKKETMIHIVKLKMVESTEPNA